jgi:chorismate mutase/prephenate dehydrogenase
MALFQDTTANLIRIPLVQHDELMSYVLGMSHMLNLAFAKAISDNRFSSKQLEAVASSTYRAQLDVAIPIINENQDLYFEIQVGNKHTKDLFREIIQAFQAYLDAVSTNDRMLFKQYMESSKKYFSP